MASINYNDSGYSIKHFIFDEKASKMTEGEQDSVIFIEKSQKNEFHPIIDCHEYRYDSDLSNLFRIKALKQYCIKSIKSYRCIQRECYGRVYVYLNDHKPIGYSLERDHGKHCNRNTNKYIERKLINAIVEKAILCDEAFTKQDYEKEKKDAKENHGIDLPTFDALKKRIYRKKQTFKTNQDAVYKEKEFCIKNVHKLYVDSNNLIFEKCDDESISSTKVILNLPNNNKTIKRVHDNFDDQHSVKLVKQCHHHHTEIIHSNDSVDSTFRNETEKENESRNRLKKLKQSKRYNKIRNYSLGLAIPHPAITSSLNKEHLNENENKMNPEMFDIVHALLSLGGNGK